MLAHVEGYLGSILKGHNTPGMENQMEKIMDNQLENWMETGILQSLLCNNNSNNGISP